MPSVLNSRYAQTATALLAVFGVGHILWDWGFIAASYGLIVYLFMALSIRLDDMAQDIRAIREARAAESDSQDLLLAQLAQINTTLVQINQHLTPCESPVEKRESIPVETPPRD